MGDMVFSLADPIGYGRGGYTQIWDGEDVPEAQTYVTPLMVNHGKFKGAWLKIVTANQTAAVAVVVSLLGPDGDLWKAFTAITADGTNYFWFGSGASAVAAAIDQAFDSPMPTAFRLKIETGNPAGTPTTDITVSILFVN